MDNIVYREAETDDAEEMISYLNIVGRESDNLMHGPDGFKAPVEAVKRRIQASHDADNSIILDRESFQGFDEFNRGVDQVCYFIRFSGDDLV